MAEPRLKQARIREGVWQAVVEGLAGTPEVQVTHLGSPVPGVTVTPLPDRPGDHAIRVPIPAALLSDGIQTFLVQDGEGTTLGQFVIATGVALEEDIRAEIDLLRAELDMLKRAFRRHCLETAG